MVSLADFQPLSIAKTNVFNRQPRFYNRQHLHKEANLFEIQVRLVSDCKLQRIQRQTYRRLQTKIF